MSEGRILFIDAYDSFSNNIIALLESELSVSVETIKINDPRFVLNDDAFRKFLHGFDAVVAGPGPGHPGNASDVGLIGQLWSLQDDSLIPVLGICLGFQSLALAFGGSVERLREPRHGMVTPVLHIGRDVFDQTGEVVATQYHSLHVKTGINLDQMRTKGLWRPSKSCKELLPLAWDLSDESNGPTLMGARHCHNPFWGLQYHPESICTNNAGKGLISNWWSNVQLWNRSHDRIRIGIQHCLGKQDMNPRGVGKCVRPSSTKFVQWKTIQQTRPIDVADIVGCLRAEHCNTEPILLESGLRNGAPVNSETGRFSVIGIPDQHSIQIRYSVKEANVTLSTANRILAAWKSTISDTCAFLETFMNRHQAADGPEDVPFWGGLVGFISYEAGLESIDVSPAGGPEEPADMWFVFVERSIVVDHISGQVYLQSVRDDDRDWIWFAEKRLRQVISAERPVLANSEKVHAAGKIVFSPEVHEYCRKVKFCQDYLRAGSSYELCLTDTTSIRCESDPWLLYVRLRQLNPAPFGAYFSVAATSPGHGSAMHQLSLLSSSPERFLSWSRDGKCQFRPIKGTVKKCPDVTRKDAERILNSPKERAENLMIVDLIRHDLNGVGSARNVNVPKLMSVEEYESVYQLVSVIEGDLGGSGIPVLAASLPPGSMTGAPKKRSCELLNEIEGGKARGLYSGVFGYLDVGGGGDFSVVIRSAFKWNDEEWRVGAGGAVTALSEAKAEWQEMLAKRENVLRAFS